MRFYLLYLCVIVIFQYKDIFSFTERMLRLKAYSKRS